LHMLVLLAVSGAKSFVTNLFYFVLMDSHNRLKLEKLIERKKLII